MGATAEYLFRVRTNSHTNPLDIKRGNQSLLGVRSGEPFPNWVSIPNKGLERRREL